MKRRAGRLLPFALLFPAVAFFTLLVLVPIGQALFLAATAETGALTLQNVERMRADVNFDNAWRDTLLVLLLMVPLQVALALPMALLVVSRFRGRGLFLQLYAIPLAVSDLAAGLLWVAVFTERGYLNSALSAAGVIDRPIPFLSFDAGILSAIVIAEAWRGTATVFIILVAALRLIPREHFETAELFGANRVGRTVHVLLPQIRPSVWSAVLVRIAFALQIFAAVFALAGGNTPVLAGEAYTSYATNRDVPVAAAYALLVIGLALIPMVMYLRILEPRLPGAPH